MSGPLSPNMINAGSGITPSDNDGPPSSGYFSLCVNQQLLQAIAAYVALPVISGYRSVYQQMGTIGGFSAEQALMDQIQLADWPAFSDAAPYSGTSSAVSPLISGNPAATNNGPSPAPGWRVPFSRTTRFMTGLINANAELIMGYTSPGFTPTSDRDLTRFAQIQAIAASYKGQANDQINSAANAAGLNTVFTDMNALMTGSVSLINSNIEDLGDDLQAMGNLINFQFLTYLGYPSFLIRQMLTIGGLLPAVYNALTTGYTGDIAILVRRLSSGNQPLDLSIERQIYLALETIQGPNLQSVLDLLSVTTAGLETAADLLDPQLIFRKSYATMTSPVPGGDQPLLQDPIYQDLALVITPALALANAQMITRFGQVKNIRAVSLPDFAATVSSIEGDQGLGSVQQLSEAVPQSVITAITTSLATGTGPNGSITLYDLIGTAAGHVHTEAIEQTTDILSGIDFATVIEIYTYMTNTLNGDYTTFNGFTGTWTTTAPLTAPSSSVISAADSQRAPITTYIGLANSRADVIRLANPNAVSECNQLWGTMCEQLNRESLNRWKADLRFDFVTNTYPDIQDFARPAALALINQLHQFGLDVSEGNANQFLEKTADTSNLGGQSVLASLRESRNLQAMREGGLGIDTQLSNTPAA